MAAAVVPPPAVDLKATDSFNVRLGASILKEDTQRRYRNVRYNHKPRPAQGATVTSKLLPGRPDRASTLVVEDEGKEWRYTGRNTRGDGTYVLILGGGGNKDVVLEKLESSHAVNLIQTPNNDDQESLAKKHPHLTDNESSNDEDGIIGDDGDVDDPEPDASNPFDFRHFLKSVEEAQQREEQSSQRIRSTMGTPLQKAATSKVAPRPAKSPLTTATAKKRKTPSAAATRPDPKRVRAGEHGPSSSSRPQSIQPSDRRAIRRAGLANRLRRRRRAHPRKLVR
jgi:hypothetical protein